MYNEDFKYYSDFKYILPEQIKTWDFEELDCASREYINTYFNQQRFFDRLNFMSQAYETLRKFALQGEVIIVSSGYNPNLRAKEKWCKEHLPFCQFIGVNLKEYKLTLLLLLLCGGVNAINIIFYYVLAIMRKQKYMTILYIIVCLVSFLIMDTMTGRMGLMGASLGYLILVSLLAALLLVYIIIQTRRNTKNE